MQLKNSLIENLVGLLTGKIEHFYSETAGILRLIDKTVSAGIDHNSARERHLRRHRALSRTDVGRIRLERTHVFYRRADRQAHFDAVAGAAMVAWKRNANGFGNILGQQLGARAGSAGRPNNFLGTEKGG